MHRSSETIGAIAAALAKAQAELTNPEKSLTATIRSPYPRGVDRSFRYAPLSSGLDIVRKSLGQHEIATIQTTAIDRESGLVRLTTVLAHASGEWISSDWPICAISETAIPQQMGAALTYARRYALFTLVGIAGEDDIDAPELLVEASPRAETSPDASNAAPNIGAPQNASVDKPRKAKPLLAAGPSAALCDQLVAEIRELADAEDLALWAHQKLPAKNSLTTDDARAVEAAYLAVLARNRDTDGAPAQIPGPSLDLTLNGTEQGSAVDSPGDRQPLTSEKLSPLRKSIRRRNKAHLALVAAQPCLLCQRSPCDAHHLRFAQPRTLGRKVSDEFTVPLCRDHHRDLHRYGNEVAWWANLQIAPLQIAKELWHTSCSISEVGSLAADRIGPMTAQSE
jgi:hypothetical protein